MRNAGIGEDVHDSQVGAAIWPLGWSLSLEEQPWEAQNGSYTAGQTGLVSAVIIRGLDSTVKDKREGGLPRCPR